MDTIEAGGFKSENDSGIIYLSRGQFWVRCPVSIVCASIVATT
jgi:hypothetical protein